MIAHSIVTSRGGSTNADRSRTNWLMGAEYARVTFCVNTYVGMALAKPVLGLYYILNNILHYIS